MYTYIIIDNDEETIASLQQQMSEFERFSCVGVSRNYQEALDLILKSTPKLVFLNVDDVTGNEFSNPFHFVNELYQYSNIVPTFIALSISKDKAYTVIKNDFFDYLLKPLHLFDVRKTVMRFLKKFNEEFSNSTICLKSYKDYRFIETEDVLYLKADNNATDFFMKNDTVVSAYKTLKFFESILPDNFIRIHNSYIINTDYVSRIHFGKSKCSIKNESFQIPFSNSYKHNVESLKNTLSHTAIHSVN